MFPAISKAFQKLMPEWAPVPRQELHRAIPDNRYPGVNPDLLHPFDLQGEAWFDARPKPIALIWGFNPWKRPFTQPYFPEYKLAFVRGRRPFIRLEKFEKRFPPHEGLVFISWGLKIPGWALRYARERNIKVLYVEDGFLRSFNPGALHTKPYSLAIDECAPYYVAREETKLRTLLRSAPDTVDSELASKAKAGMALMRAAKLTKYYPMNIVEQTRFPRAVDKKKIILIIGQVEDDAANIHGYSGTFSNYNLFAQAVKDHPESYIFYRPHPDVFYNNRRSRAEDRLRKYCTVIEPSTDLHSLFAVVDHVYTATSLAGLEAMIWGLPVTTLGTAFYSGFGLDNHSPHGAQPSAKAKPKLTLEQLFAISYLVYPKYIHPESQEESNFFDLASYFIVEKYKHLSLKGGGADYLDIEALEQVGEKFSVPGRLLLHLWKGGREALGDDKEISEMLSRDFKFHDFRQVTDILEASCRFDMLSTYLKIAEQRLHEDIEHLKGNVFLFERVLESFLRSQRALRGRDRFVLPDISEWMFPIESANYRISDAFLVTYISCLSHNIQYTELDKIIRRIEGAYITSSVKPSSHALRRIIQVLIQKPARSERNAGKRNELTERLSNLYGRLLGENWGDIIDAIVNRALVKQAMDRKNDCVAAVQELIKVVDVATEEGMLKKVEASLQARARELVNVIRYLSRHSVHDVVDRLIEIVAKHLDREGENALILLRVLLERGDYDRFKTVYLQLSEDDKNRTEVRDLYTRYLMDRGEFVFAKKITRSALAGNSISQAKRNLLNSLSDAIDFSIEASRILNSVPQPLVPRGVVFMACHTDLKTVAMLIPALVEAKRKGYAVISLANGVIAQTATGIGYIDQFMGSIPVTQATGKHEYNNEWYIDWKKRIVRSDGVNYYEGFYEALTNFFRTYEIDLNKEAVRRSFDYRLMRADDSLSVCRRALRDVAARGIPVIFVSGDAHIVPFSIFRDFCRHHNHPNMSFVNVNVGYESYFSNLGSKLSTTMTVTDMTLHPTHRAPFLARPDRFEKWYAANQKNPAYKARADELISANRVHAESSASANQLIAFLREQRSKGKKIICCLGKIPIDLAVPYDGGPGHSDLKDWLNDTIDAVKGLDDVILLIKPHPHELRPEIALDLVDRFTDLIEVALSDNVRILEHREINNHELAAHIDLALMWNGSSSLELAAQGVPVMMTSYFGKHDYPVDLIYPNDRSHYRQFIAGGQYGTVDPETRMRAAYLISYMETPDVSIRNDYAYRPLTNDFVGVPTWKPERVEELIANGDPEMVRAANRILERFEGPCD